MNNPAAELHALWNSGSDPAQSQTVVRLLAKALAEAQAKNGDDDDNSSLEDVLAELSQIGTAFIKPLPVVPNIKALSGHPDFAAEKHQWRQEASEASDTVAQVNRIRKRLEYYLHQAKALRQPYLAWQIFEAVYAGSLELNSWSNDIYLDGENVGKEVGPLLIRLEDTLKLSLHKFAVVIEARCLHLLKAQQFNPVTRYLKQLPKPTDNDRANFSKLADRVCGSSDPLDQKRLSKWLVAAVARAVEPGCQADNVLILKGGQGTSKTTLLRRLFGEHFNTIHSHKTGDERARLLQSTWGGELGEIEATFRASDTSALKAFLTECNDNYRDLYAKTPLQRPRHFVLAGTTNEASILSDSTGSRRFWVIDCNDHDIPVEWVTENRDAIWACAYELYLQGEQWWLSKEDTALSEVANKAFELDNPFEEKLLEQLTKLENAIAEEGAGIAISATQALEYILDVKVENQAKHRRQLSSTMATLGYERRQFGTKDLRGWFYCHKDTVTAKPITDTLKNLIRR